MVLSRLFQVGISAVETEAVSPAAVIHRIAKANRRRAVATGRRRRPFPGEWDADDRSAAKPACLGQQVKHSAKCICYCTGLTELNQSLHRLSLLAREKVLLKTQKSEENPVWTSGPLKNLVTGSHHHLEDWHCFVTGAPRNDRSGASQQVCRGFYTTHRVGVFTTLQSLSGVTITFRIAGSYRCHLRMLYR